MPGGGGSTLREQLENLLQEPVAAAEARARDTFDETIVSTRGNLVLFGTGSVGRRVLEALREDGIEPLAFSDNNCAKWGASVDELAILSPEEAAQRHGREATFLVTVYNHWHAFPRTRNQLQDLGCKNVTSVIPLRWKYHDRFLPYYRDDLPHKVLLQREDILKAFLLWSDELSQKEFVAQVRWRLHGDFDVLAEPTFDDQYFPKGLVRLTSDEFFVDVGAFDGDTIRAFLAHRSDFKRLIALEPDPANFLSLVNYIESLPAELAQKIEARQLAAGASKGKIRFRAAGSDGSAISEHGSIEVDCIPLDDLLKGRRPTYLKFDVEGAELDALRGSEATISRSRPRVAACAYHLQDHLWKIPLEIEHLMPESPLFLRTHMYECWETVCYALPAE